MATKRPPATASTDQAAAIITGRRVFRRHHVIRDNTDVGLVLGLSGPEATVRWGDAEIRTQPTADLAALPLPEWPYACEIRSILRRAGAVAPHRVRQPHNTQRDGTSETAIDFPHNTTYTEFAAAFTALADVYGDRVRALAHEFAEGPALWIVLQTSQWVTAGITHDVYTITDPRTGQPVRLCIDADCPRCDHPERWFDTGTRLFGCAKCNYISSDRNH